jgi:recombination protein RecR
MPALPPAFDKLVTLLSRLPGIGQRSATRLAFFIIAEPGNYASALGKTLVEAVDHVRYCADCHTLTEDELCSLCRDPSRDRETVCIVEAVQDLLAFERSGAYQGLYHVLHGALAPLKGIGPSQLRMGNLEDRLRPAEDSEKPAVTEVILATNSDVEGEATALYLAKRLKPLGITTSRIATGIPMGGELEYIDQMTLSRALTGRVPLSV